MSAEQIKQYIERRKERCEENLDWAKEINKKEVILHFQAQYDELEDILKNIR